MAVEITFLTVLLRKDRLAGLDPGRADLARQLFAYLPDWLREDADLLATSFMAPAAVRAFGTALEARCGLHRGRDWAVVDMALGPTFPVDWLRWQGGVGELTGAWLAGADPRHLARTRNLIPGQPRREARILKLFGRDHPDDTEEHRADFGTVIPEWGGKDVWLVERNSGGEWKCPA